MKRFIFKKFSSLNFHLSILISQFSSQKGFTLIELLIVIAILGVLAAGMLVAIDPIDKINTANDAKVQNDVGGIGRAAEAYAVTHGGFYPKIIDDLQTSGELKRVPVPPTGRSYVLLAVKGDCIAGSSCTSLAIYSYLKSKKHTATPLWLYESSSGKSCAINAGVSIDTATETKLCP